MNAHQNRGERTLICYAGQTSKTLIDSKPIGSELAAEDGPTNPQSQLLVDKTPRCRYPKFNRARHASPRCAPGGTFFARRTCTGLAVKP